MGMYDSINGEQVKCFGIPVYYGNEGVSQMGGLLRSYGTGNKVPYKTMYYNYTKDFCIVDIHPYEKEDEAIIHVIENGKVKKTVTYKELTDEDFNNKICIGYYGDYLDLRRKEDILLMKEDLSYFSSQYSELTKDSSAIMKELFNLRGAEPTEEIKKKREELLKKVDEVRAIEQVAIEELRKARVTIYYKKAPYERYDECCKLGEYISAEIDYYNKKGFTEPENILEMKKYIFESINDENLVECYCKFQSIGKKKFNNIIESIKNQK